MEISVMQIALAIAIVLVSGAIAMCKVIDARAEVQKVSRPSFMAGLKDLEKIQKKGSFNALIPGIEEAAKNNKSPSYQEAMLVEQLGCRIETAGINLNNISNQITEFQNIKSQAKKNAIVNNFNAANEHYCNAFDAAAYWHLQGLISFPVYKEHFLQATIDTYDDIDIAKKWANIAEIEKQYGHLIRVTEEESKEAE